MKKLTFFYVLALLILTVPVSCKKEDAGSVSGYVTAFDNQEPIEGATVYLRKYTHAGPKDDNFNFSPNNSAHDSREWVTDSISTDKNGYFSFDSPYPIIVFTKKEHYYVDQSFATNTILKQNTENVVNLQLAPYAWVKIRGHNNSGAYQLLTFGADDKPYTLSASQNETREMVVPAFNGSFSRNYYLKTANDELILPPNSNTRYYKVDCQYRDTTLLELEY